MRAWAQFYKKNMDGKYIKIAVNGIAYLDGTKSIYSMMVECKRIARSRAYRPDAFQIHLSERLCQENPVTPIMEVLEV